LLHYKHFLFCHFRDLIFLWSKLQLKLNHSKQLFIERCYNMLRIATNLKGIFPFMKAIINEIGEAGVQLSVELCGCALQLDLNHDPETKSLIYKTIACLLPTDLEICRICVLSVFFLERTMETYYAVERLYKCSDEDYNEFTSYVENRVRFELLPILKRGLIFDPEFWSFSMIQENCFAFLQNKTSLDNVTNKEIVTQALPMEATKSVKDLINGVLELEHSTNVKSSTIFASYKMDHNNVPRHLCTLCNKEFLGGHIFRHAQAHQKRGCFSCVICARKFRNRFIMLKHLKSHINKIQRRHMAALAAISNDTLNETPNTNEVHLSDASSLCIENENSSSSTKEVLSDVLVATHQESSPESLVPVENHVIENNNNDKPNNLTDLIISENNLELIDKQLLEENLDSNMPDLVKINGSLCSMNEDPAIKDNVLNHQDVFECPAQGCDRTFKRICNLNKHARKTHPTDLKVQQHILTWNKGKCRFCQRLFTDSKHFIEHLQRHVYPNVYFCPFVNCNESFKLSGQLTEHKASHTKCIVQCSYINCCELFEDFSMLYKHEAQHYEQTALKAVNPLTALEPKCNATDFSEPFKQIPAVPKESMDKIRKPKVVDFPVPIWKSKKDLAEPKTYTQTEKKMNGYVISQNSLLDSSTTSEVKNNPSLVLEANVESPTDEEKNINGYSVREKTHANDIHFNCAHSTQKPLENVSDTVLEGPQESSADQEQNPSKPKSNTGIVSCGKVWPFSRPLPSAYLDEQYISMPKRRKADEEHKFEIDTNCTKSVEMFRCGKCLTNYCSSEALEKHRAQNKCQQYFGFDSDDE
ncbi:zinc finger protein 654-like, partial [Bombina bombina]|uniref:zinc finger protein 654-like n=1 Tax=Bombina bombina TaxID=8345 RepID=UPI00235A9838